MDLIAELQNHSNFSIVPDMSLPKEIAAWDLGSGESQVLAQCWKCPKMSCAILVDLAARKCAKGAEVRVLGTLGIVIKAKQTGLIPLARPILELLLRKGMYLNIDLIQSILKDVGE